jgi:hypothetical protein
VLRDIHGSHNHSERPPRGASRSSYYVTEVVVGLFIWAPISTRARTSGRGGHTDTTERIGGYGGGRKCKILGS